jgi:hypothetical protein
MDWNEIPHGLSYLVVTSGVSKMFLSLWYIQCKACTYLASRLAPYPNGLNQACTWASSPTSTVWCVQNDFWAYCMFGAKRAPSLHRTNTLFRRTRMKFHKNHITYEFHGVCPKWFLGLRYVQCKCFIHLASRLALSPNGLNRASTWASSPCTTIAGIQNDSEPMVCLAQTMHISCTNTNTISN